MKLKTLTMLFVIILPFVFVGCATTVDGPIENLIQTDQFAYQEGAGFLPAEPYRAKGTVEIARDGRVQEVDFLLLTPEEVDRLLSNTDSELSIAKKTTNGKISFLTGSLTGEKGSYVAWVDYSKYTIEVLKDSNSGERLGDAKIGVGSRMRIEVYTKKRGLDLGSLLKIGIAASKNELTGKIRIKTMGIITERFDTSQYNSINEVSIQAALQDLAVLKAQLQAEDTELVPTILAVRPDPEEVSQMSIQAFMPDTG